MSAYRKYWITWLVLLAVTGVMMGVGSIPASRWLVISLLLAAMAVKSGMIAGTFMHLRQEQRALVLMVVLGILSVGITLFAGIAPDGARIARLSEIP